MGISQIEIQLGSNLAVPVDSLDEAAKAPPAANSPAKVKRQDGRHE
jgi:hypothetical protein